MSTVNPEPPGSSDPQTRKKSMQSTGLDTDAILSEAARQFRERGFDRTRMQDIAEPFGVTHAALYYYFPSKSDLLTSLNTSALEGLINRSRKAAQNERSPDARFIAQLREHIRFVLGSIDLAGIFFEHEERMGADGYMIVRKMRKEYTDLLVASFKAAQKDGRFRETVSAKMAVGLLLGAVNWMYRWIEADFDGVEEHETLVETVLAMLVEGIWADKDQAENVSSP